MGRERWREDRGLGFRKLSKEQNIEREYVLVCVSIGVCVLEGEEVEREIEMESDIWYHGQTTNILLNDVLKQKVQSHRQGPHRLPKYRCLRTSSGLEASFLHYRAALHPGGKALSLESLHVRSNLWEWEWNTHALQQ